MDEITKESTLLGEAISRLRAGRVIKQAGYDGEYGVIRLFEDGELKHPLISPFLKKIEEDLLTLSKFEKQYQEKEHSGQLSLF